MRIRAVLCFFSSLLLLGQNLVFSQSISLNGQLSGWLNGNQENSLISQAGFRYIPDVFLEKTINNHLHSDAVISLNTYAIGNFSDWETLDTDGKLKAYRLWVRLAGNRFETRIGLQKINFGSATLFRPLMWFDRVDPRDPLKLTDGVYGLLLRYYFQNNTNIWVWGLYNNDLKGWETVPTEKNGLEFGSRLQFPIFTGEAGISYHHRNADFSRLPAQALFSNATLVKENRFALDLKLNVKIGLWFEGAIIHKDTQIPQMNYQRMGTIGADYTFNIGNGLNVLAEFFNSENSNKIFGAGDGIKFTGSTINYPIGLLDRVSGFHYYDWANHENYLLLNWQRTYDSWIFHLIGFFNPKIARVNQTKSRTNAFSGNGFQIMVVFNH